MTTSPRETEARAFNRRCASALTHPATVAAIALLLVNDILFKQLWPHPWVTGKISDLAWMVFAPPLLALLLGFAMGRSAAGRRAAFLTAYAGLPLLYAAFNTFAPVHDWILRGLLFFSGETVGSPLDAADSLVIPIGLGAALAVWRRPPVGAQSLRLRWSLLAAGAAAFATIATSPYSQAQGITDVGISRNGEVCGSGPFSATWWSNDGGYSWVRDSTCIIQGVRQQGSVETPRGDYAIDDSGIVRVHADGRRELVYATAYLRQESNVWAQENATEHLGFRRITDRPYGIAYDARSGNLIAAMGIQGVVVGAPNGEWTAVAIGEYAPTDFSFFAKTGRLLSHVGFWLAVLPLALAMTSLGALLAYSKPNWMVLAAGDLALPAEREGGSNISWIGLAAGALALLLATIALINWPNVDNEDTGPIVGALARQFLLGAPAIGLGICALSLACREEWMWRLALPAFAGILVLAVLPFVLWLQVGLPLGLAVVSALALTALAAFGLLICLRRQQRRRPGQGAA